MLNGENVRPVIAAFDAVAVRSTVESLDLLLHVGPLVLARFRPFESTPGVQTEREGVGIEVVEERGDVAREVGRGERVNGTWLTDIGKCCIMTLMSD